MVSGVVNWPQSYHDSGHTGYNKNEATLYPGNVGGLSLLGGTTSLGFVTGFAINNSVIYAKTCCDSNQGTLYAIDASTFATKWSVPVGTGNPAGENVVVAGSRVFSACLGSNSSVGLCAYSTGSGKQLWAYNPGSCQGCSASGIIDGPAYGNGTVYLAMSNGYNSSQDGVYALNAATGQVVWTHIDGNNNINGASGIALANGLVYYDCGASFVYGVCALHQSDGTGAWSYLNMTIAARTVSGGVVYANGYPQPNGGQDTIFALNGTTGAVLWSYTYTSQCCGPATPQPPAVAQGKVYVAAGGYLYAFSAKTGSLKWSVADNDMSDMSLANGVAYYQRTVSAVGTELRALQTTNGATLYTSAAGNGHSNAPPPIVLNGKVYGTFTDSSCVLCEYGLAAPKHRK